LIKPQVYRHLLFNRLGRDDDKFDVRVRTDFGLGDVLTLSQPSIIRLGILLLLFDVYLTWARIEKSGTSNASPTGALSSYPLLLQYLYFLVYCLLGTLAFHIPVRLICTSPSFRWLRRITTLPEYPKPTPLSTALIVSSCTKLFPILLIVWEYDLPSAASAVSWAVIVNNVAALEILMDCGYVRAFVLVVMGAFARAAVGWWALGVIGLKEKSWEDVGALMVSESFADTWKWLGVWG